MQVDYQRKFVWRRMMLPRLVLSNCVTVQFAVSEIALHTGKVSKISFSESVLDLSFKNKRDFHVLEITTTFEGCIS